MEAQVREGGQQQKEDEHRLQQHEARLNNQGVLWKHNSQMSERRGGFGDPNRGAAAALTQQQQQRRPQSSQVREPELQGQQVGQRNTESSTQSRHTPKTPHTHAAGILCATKETHLPPVKVRLRLNHSFYSHSYQLQFGSTHSSHQILQDKLQQTHRHVSGRQVFSCCLEDP